MRYNELDMLEQRTFTVDDLTLMDEAGLFGGQRIELINGVIFEMSPTGPSHAHTVDVLTEEFVQQFAGRARVRVQSPVSLNDENWMPIPDITLIKLGDYSGKHPIPKDILLLVEVSSTTLKTDLGAKLEAYASAGIADYWIADLNTDEWIIHRDPAPGRYRSITRLDFSESVAPQAFAEDTRRWLA